MGSRQQIETPLFDFFVVRFSIKQIGSFYLYFQFLYNNVLSYDTQISYITYKPVCSIILAPFTVEGNSHDL